IRLVVVYHMVLQKSPERAVLWGYRGCTGYHLFFMCCEAKVQNSRATFTDVLFGDIWLCGRQSNMCFKVSQELALVAKYSHVSPFTAVKSKSGSELMDLTEVEIPWSVSTTHKGEDFFELKCFCFCSSMN
uniref:Uncharacterized protein n=1 Tax=Oreochromis niloticus TaxID=8128 RepID=A0A669BJ52_ORENI